MSDNESKNLAPSETVEEEIFYSEPGSEITKPFDPKKIDIQTKQMILEAIFRRLRNNEIDMNTGFQRKSDLWDSTKQSRLIESILIRFPLPAFYFDGTNDNKWLVVDGLQRLSAFKNFIIDKTLTLQGLEYLYQFNGNAFDELPRDLQRRIEEHEITIYIINPGTPPEVKYNIFRRINTGGLILEPAEIRHALNQGAPADFVKELADSKEFKEATTYSILSDRMLDRDFVTRFLAFYLHPAHEYKGNLEDYLNAVMGELNKTETNKLNKIRHDFRASMLTAKKIFGRHAFRKLYRKNDRRKPLNKAMFEVWSVSLAKLTDAKRDALANQKAQVLKEFMAALNNDSAFEKAISTGTGEKRTVLKRFETIDNIIKSAISYD